MKNNPHHDAKPLTNMKPMERRLVFYAAVGGTAVVIVALWLMILPVQLERSRQGYKDDATWRLVQDNLGTAKQSFSDTIRQIEDRMAALDVAATQPAGSTPNFNDLSNKLIDNGEKLIATDNVKEQNHAPAQP